jgi:hypothetical protein
MPMPTVPCTPTMPVPIPAPTDAGAPSASTCTTIAFAPSFAASCLSRRITASILPCAFQARDRALEVSRIAISS